MKVLSTPETQYLISNTVAEKVEEYQKLLASCGRTATVEIPAHRVEDRDLYATIDLAKPLTWRESRDPIADPVDSEAGAEELRLEIWELQHELSEAAEYAEMASRARE